VLKRGPGIHNRWPSGLDVPESIVDMDSGLLTALGPGMMIARRKNIIICGSFGTAL
jgi:hypothetical protein